MPLQPFPPGFQEGAIMHPSLSDDELVRQLRLKDSTSFFSPPQRAGVRVMTPGGFGKVIGLDRVTEVRRLTDTNHQTTVITTARRLDNAVIAGSMFARWRQEIMMLHHDIAGACPRRCGRGEEAFAMVCSGVLRKVSGDLRGVRGTGR